VGGAGAVLRGVEARGAGARPPPALLQALQLLLLRPPAQHLREFSQFTFPSIHLLYVLHHRSMLLVNFLRLARYSFFRVLG